MKNEDIELEEVETDNSEKETKERRRSMMKRRETTDDEARVSLICCSFWSKSKATKETSEEPKEISKVSNFKIGKAGG